jgi:hypothetical protein
MPLKRNFGAAVRSGGASVVTASTAILADLAGVPRAVLVTPRQCAGHYGEAGAIALITALGIVGFWRGTWMLLDVYLFPGNPLLFAATKGSQPSRSSGI